MQQNACCQYLEIHRLGFSGDGIFVKEFVAFITQHAKNPDYGSNILPRTALRYDIGEQVFPPLDAGLGLLLHFCSVPLLPVFTPNRDVIRVYRRLRYRIIQRVSIPLDTKGMNDTGDDDGTICVWIFSKFAICNNIRVCPCTQVA